MLNRKVNNQYTGIYRTKDSIDNFRFRVTLKKLYSIIKIPKFDLIPSAQAPTENTTSDFEETLTFKWQQKLFSDAEKAYFSIKENCKSDLEKKYHQIIKEEPQDSKRIYSCVEEDKFEFNGNFVKEKQLPPTKLKLLVDNSNKTEIKEVEQENSSPGSSQLDFQKSFEDLNERYTKVDNFQTMYILADLDPPSVLFLIKYRKDDGLLLVFPDFNEVDNNPYYLEIDTTSKQMYCYGIENLSKTFDQQHIQLLEEKNRENLNSGVSSELIEKLANLSLHSKPSPDFQIPKYCRILLLLEIVQAKNFEYDNVHVQYEIKYPNFMKLVDGSAVGATHSSSKRNNVWNFGHCHSFVLDIDDEFSVDRNLNKIILNLEAISIDTLWDRERREGLTFFSAPLDSSRTYEEDLLCYRDVQGANFAMDWIERFFLGGLHKTTFAATNTVRQESIVNRLGNHTVSTGTLKIKLQVVRQLRCSLQLQSGGMPTVDEVILAYRKTKSRLEKTS